MSALLDRIVAPLKTVGGIEAIVLGGSRARGLHGSASDYDIGIYYSSAQAFDIAALNEVARALDDEHREDLCTPLGGWGPWVNGGGWLFIDGVAVDFIYRDIQRVSQVIEDCCAGKLMIEMQAGHPYGFVSAIYMGEVATCQVLWEHADALSKLKAKTQPYPSALKKAVFNQISWEPRFCADLAEKGMHKRDSVVEDFGECATHLPRFSAELVAMQVRRTFIFQLRDSAYIAGCLFRAVTGMLHTLAAINEVYVLNEKGLTDLAAQFAIVPKNLRTRIQQIFERMATTPDAAITMLRELIAEVDTLRDSNL